MTGNARSSGYERALNDWYVEPEGAAAALFRAERFSPGTAIHDPACGSGNIPRTAEKLGLSASGSDLIDRGYGVTHDFLSQAWPFDQPAAIVTNPPFRLAEQFVHRALKITDRVAVLQRLAFAESAKRNPLMRTLARLWIFSDRVSMPPGGTDVPVGNGSVAYAWFVWDRNHFGPANVGFIWCEESKS